MIDMSPYKHTAHPPPPPPPPSSSIPPEKSDTHPPSSSSSSSSSAISPDYVHVLPTPDTYRGLFSSSSSYLQHTTTLLSSLLHPPTHPPRRLAAFFAETVLACGGQVVLPPGYLGGVGGWKEGEVEVGGREEGMYAFVRSLGGLCVADEVQTGFGRTGKMWAFEWQGKELRRGGWSWVGWWVGRSSFSHSFVYRSFVHPPTHLLFPPIQT